MEKILVYFVLQAVLFAILIGYASLGGLIFMKIEYDNPLTFAEAFTFTMTTITTVGYGYICPEKTWGRVFTIIYVIIGIPLMLLFLVNIGCFLGMCSRLFYQRVICGLCRPRRNQSGASLGIVMEKPNGSGECPDNGERGETGTGTVKAETDPNDGKKLPPEAQVEVPVVIVLIIPILYVLLGATVFSFWEDRDFLSSFYFCVVTLTTIGFGDVYPESKPGNQIFCSFYILMGLSLLALCYDLIQERVRYMCTQVALKVGSIFGRRGE